VFGQADRAAAFDATRRIISQLSQSLQTARVVAAGQTIATIKPAWTGAIDIVAAADAQMLYWPGMTLEASVEFQAVKAPLKAGDQVGTLVLKLGEQQQTVPLKLGRDLPKASLIWKLTRT
jgi:D-alanyl-D-alanine carboxypeptidase